MFLRLVLITACGALGVAASCSLAGCNDTAIVLDIASNRSPGELDAICVELDAGSSARFGRRYDVTAKGNPLPQSLTALASGRSAMQALVYGEKRGIVVARAREYLPFKSGTSLHVPMALDRCQPHATSATFTMGNALLTADWAVLVPAHLASPGDIAVAELRGESEELTVLTKISPLGGGTPARPVPGLPAMQTTQMISADFDGDCRPEIVIVGGNNAPIILRDDGTSSYAASGSVGPSGMSGVAAGDVDGDGKVDLVLAGGAEAHVFLGDGSGKFHELGGALDQPPADATAIALADLDGDGNLDLVIGQGATTAAPARVYLNDKAGSGHFTYAAGALPPRPMRVAAVAVGDVDGDGTLDVVTGELGGPVRLWLNRGDAYLDDRSFDLLPDQTSGDVKSLLLVDLNDDCLLDLVVPRAGAAPLLWLGQGGGLLASGPTLTAAGDAVGAVSDDVNGDGVPDLLLFGGTAGLQLELQR